jgi:DNA invertase Pin-like site-specific DNA recombinase
MQTLQNAVGYCRVSSREQAQNSHALENQIARVREAIGPDAPLFTDICSGTKTSRPGFNQMLEVLGSGAFACVVITRPDRLGRNHTIGFQQIVNWWIGKPKIRTVALELPIDLDNTGGRMNLSMLSELSIFEVDMLSTRIRASHKQRMVAGTSKARPPFGYLFRDGVMVPDEEKRHCLLSQKPKNACKTMTAARGVAKGVSNADLARLAFATFLSRASYVEACRELEPWALTRSEGYTTVHDNGTFIHARPSFPPSDNTLRNWLHNPVYRGHRGHRRNYNADFRPANGERKNFYNSTGSASTYEYMHYDQHPALISEEDYQKILVIEERHKIFRNESGKIGAISRSKSLNKYPLSGILRCTCGRSPNPDGKEMPTYRCKNPLCDNRISIRADRAALSVAMHLQQMAARIQSGQEELPEIQNGDEAVIAHLNSVLDHLRACPDQSIVAAQVQEVQRRIEQLEGKPGSKEFLQGTARQILRDPRAADWAYWAKAATNTDFLLHRLPLLITQAVIGYASPEDRPIERSKGRPVGWKAGKPSVLAVTLR